MTAAESETVDPTRAALDTAARRLFEEHGYADTRVTAITDEAGVALSTFYAKYGSKEQAWLTTMGTTPPDRPADGRPPRGRAARTRAALVAAARDVIEQDGYHAARVTDIAERAGAAIGSFYHHFPSKQAVFTAVVHEQLAALEVTTTAGIESAEGEGVSTDGDDRIATLTAEQRREHAIERTAAAIDTYLNAYSGHTSLLLFRLDEAIGTHPELVEVRLAVHRRFASTIAASVRRWQAEGIADASLDADHAGDALAAMVGHATRVWTVFASPHDRETAAKTLTLLWCNGVGLRTP
jgi:AcrR family transcriptional regulator